MSALPSTAVVVAVGACVSFTVTVNVQVLVSKEASVAVTVTVCVPTANVLPEAGDAAELTPGQLSVEDGKVKLTTALHMPASFA